MNRELLIFGSDGALGKGASEVLLRKDYSKVYLFGSSLKNSSEEKIIRIKTADLSLEENVRQIFNSIKSKPGTLFFLFSTIGGYFSKEISDTELADFERMININLKVHFLLAKYFSRLVKRSSGGSIMFTSALTSLNSAETKGIYGASKEALNHLVETLALEGRNFNMTINAIAPNVINTPANMEWFTGDTGTLIQPEEAGEFVNDIFNNFHFITGNIFKLSHRLLINV